MSGEGPAPAVLEAFGLTGDPAPLSGGMEPVFLVGGVVLKRAEMDEEVSWRSELLSRLPEQGYRLARPVTTLDGRWSDRGWTATRHVDGRHGPPRWAELVAATRAFHHVLAGTLRPEHLDRLGHRWARAHRVALGSAEVEVVGDVGRRLDALHEMLVPVHATSQLIHADLAGNALFSDDAAPAILDFSPWWAPVAYAEGILMVDALLWFGGRESCLSLVADVPDLAQWLLRGAVFRLVALNEGLKEGHPEYAGEVERFDGLIDVIRALE